MKQRDKMASTWLGAGLAVLVAASCGSPRPSTPVDGGGVGPAIPQSLELIAGDTGGPGSVDGTGADARFRHPHGMAIDGAGNLYIADTNSSTIRKTTPTGVVTTLVGTADRFGSADGAGAAARFALPFGVAADSAGNLYIADSNNHTIRKVTAAGVVTTFAGTAEVSGSANGTGTAASFNFPTGVAIDGAGNLYVADEFNRTIRKVTAAGVVTTLAGTAGVFGHTDDTGAAASFMKPASVAVDTTGTVYVADECAIRKVTPDGVVTTLAGSTDCGSADGTGTAASFEGPSGVAVDGAGNVYVADSFNSTLRKVTPDGAVTTVAGTAGSADNVDGAGAAARFIEPWGVAVDAAGNLYVADERSSILRKVTPDGAVTTLAGTPPRPGTADGIGTAARFDGASGLAADPAGNLYVADTNNNTIRKITPGGVVTTLAGTAGTAGSANGTGTAARFSFPFDVAVDATGNVYVADNENSTIRKITPAGVVTTLAGMAGLPGNTDGTGTAASFEFPNCLAVDGTGNVYVADTNNTIRKVTPAGVVTTFAGTADMAGSADGTGTAARFNSVVALATDGAGNLYAADNGNSTIRKITPAGVVTTLAGSAGMADYADGTGATARFLDPIAVAVDAAGNVYVSDNRAIRKITPSGTTTTLAGTPGVSGIVLGAMPRFGTPIRLAIVGDSIAVLDIDAVLLLRHGVQ